MPSRLATAEGRTASRRPASSSIASAASANCSDVTPRRAAITVDSTPCCRLCQHLSDLCLMTVDSVDDPTSVLLQVDDGVDLVDALTEHGWGDGLPVVAPTPERVDAMLAGYPDHDPDEVIAILPPRFGEATRRTLAINAIMAGCRPEHLPVLEAAVRALATASPPWSSFTGR